MNDLNITDKQIKMIQDKSNDYNFWMQNLGVALIDEDSKADKNLSFDFLKIGREYFNNNIEKLKGVLCDNEKMEPKEKFKLLLNDVNKASIILLINVISEEFGEAADVIISLTALSLNKGLVAFCS